MPPKKEKKVKKACCNSCKEGKTCATKRKRRTTTVVERKPKAPIIFQLHNSQSQGHNPQNAVTLPSLSVSTSPVPIIPPASTASATTAGRGIPLKSKILRKAVATPPAASVPNPVSTVPITASAPVPPIPTMAPKPQKPARKFAAGSAAPFHPTKANTQPEVMGNARPRMDARARQDASAPKSAPTFEPVPDKIRRILPLNPDAPNNFSG